LFQSQFSNQTAQKPTKPAFVASAQATFLRGESQSVALDKKQETQA
jgi:hypothetical protein